MCCCAKGGCEETGWKKMSFLLSRVNSLPCSVLLFRFMLIHTLCLLPYLGSLWRICLLIYILFLCQFFSSSFPCDDLLRSALRLYHDLHDLDETCYSKYAARRSSGIVDLIVSLFVLIIKARLSTQYVDCLYYSRSKVNSVKYVV